MPATGIAFCAFILAVIVLIGGSVLELRSLMGADDMRYFRRQTGRRHATHDHDRDTHRTARDHDTHYATHDDDTSHSAREDNRP